MTAAKFLVEHIADMSVGETFCTLCGHTLRKRVYTNTSTGKRYCSPAHYALAEEEIQMQSDMRWLSGSRTPPKMLKV